MNNGHSSWLSICIAFKRADLSEKNFTPGEKPCDIYSRSCKTLRARNIQSHKMDTAQRWICVIARVRFTSLWRRDQDMEDFLPVLTRPKKQSDETIADESNFVDFSVSCLFSWGIRRDSFHPNKLDALASCQIMSKLSEGVMQFLVLAQVSEGVSIEQVLPHVKPKQQQFGRNIPLRLWDQSITLLTWVVLFSCVRSKPRSDGRLLPFRWRKQESWNLRFCLWSHIPDWNRYLLNPLELLKVLAGILFIEPTWESWDYKAI